MSTNVVVVGVQWGDEGKGKVVDVLAEHFDIVARYQGGANAGHTGHGILTSRLYADHPPRPEYTLTRKGRALNPILMAMKAWGEQYATSAMGAASLESDLRN